LADNKEEIRWKGKKIRFNQRQPLKYNGSHGWLGVVLSENIGLRQSRLKGGQPLTRSLVLKIVVFLVLPVLLYFSDLKQVFNLALSVPEVQYIFVVPFVSAYFFYRRKKSFLSNEQFSYLRGVLVSILAMSVYVIGFFTSFPVEIHLLSLPIFVAGITLLLFGNEALKSLLFPIGLLVFISPLPVLFMALFGSNLSVSDGALVTSILSPFFPVTVSYQPLVILNTITVTGQPLEFLINDYCSGVYSLTAFLFVAVILLHISVSSFSQKVFLMLSAVCAAYFLNILRILVLVVIGRYYGLSFQFELAHAIGGTVLSFFGTLCLLFFADKVLRISFKP